MMVDWPIQENVEGYEPWFIGDFFSNRDCSTPEVVHRCNFSIDVHRDMVSQF